MKILLVCVHYPVASGRYMADTLKRMGHEVRTAGIHVGTHVWGTHMQERYIWTPDYTLEQVTDLQSFKPELVLVMDSAPEILDWVDDLMWACPVVVFGVDNHVRNYYRDVFDHYFLAHDRAPDAWHPHRGMWTWLPCATDDHLFPNSAIPWGEREFDVCCIGVMYPDRWLVVNALKMAGLKVYAGMGLIYHEYRRAYQNSRIALVQPIHHDLPIRLFEGAGMGCAVLAEHPIPDLQQLAGEDVEYYGNPAGAVEGAIALLECDPKVAQKRVDDGSAWALLNHTWAHRSKVILDWVGGA